MQPYASVFHVNTGIHSQAAAVPINTGMMGYNMHPHPMPSSSMLHAGNNHGGILPGGSTGMGGQAQGHTTFHHHHPPPVQYSGVVTAGVGFGPPAGMATSNHYHYGMASSSNPNMMYQQHQVMHT